MHLLSIPSIAQTLQTTFIIANHKSSSSSSSSHTHNHTPFTHHHHLQYTFTFNHLFSGHIFLLPNEEYEMHTNYYFTYKYTERERVNISLPTIKLSMPTNHHSCLMFNTPHPSRVPAASHNPEVKHTGIYSNDQGKSQPHHKPTLNLILSRTSTTTYHSSNHNINSLSSILLFPFYMKAVRPHTKFFLLTNSHPFQSTMVTKQLIRDQWQIRLVVIIILNCVDPMAFIVPWLNVLTVNPTSQTY